MRTAESASLPITTEMPQSGGGNPRRPKRRIRVLHSVGHLLRGGIETWLYQVLQKFDASRFEHHMLVRTDEEEPFTQSFRDAGFRVLPCLNYSNPVKYRSNLRRVVEQNGPYDVLHVHGSNPNGLLALLFAKELGIPAKMVHSHNDLGPLLKNRSIGYRSYVGLTLRVIRLFADRGFAVSALAAQSMFGPAWAKDDRWQLLHCGIDFEPFGQKPDPSLRQSLGIPDDAFVVGHVGRFHPQKNHEFLVRIADEIAKKNPDARFLLVGDGALRNRTLAELEARGLRENVVLVADTNAMPQFMLSAMDCFVLPSHYEGMPLVSVEAQAAGLPCFLSDRITTESVVDVNLVKFLSVEDSPELWAKSILGARGRRVRDSRQHLKQFYDSKFNLERCASSLLETYESLAHLCKAGEFSGQETAHGPEVLRSAS